MNRFSHSTTNEKQTKTSFEPGDRYPEQTIPDGKFRFALSHIETGNDFFIQLISKADELSTLTETLQNQALQSAEINLLTSKVDQACLAKSSDQCWYRAEILSIAFGKARVRFVDFGDCLNVEARNLRQIENKFCQFAPYAYRCTLKNVEGKKERRSKTSTIGLLFSFVRSQ